MLRIYFELVFCYLCSYCNNISNECLQSLQKIQEYLKYYDKALCRRPIQIVLRKERQSHYGNIYYSVKAFLLAIENGIEWNTKAPLQTHREVTTAIVP